MITNRVKTLSEQITHAMLMIRTATANGDTRGVQMWTARYERLNVQAWALVGAN